MFKNTIFLLLIISTFSSFVACSKNLDEIDPDADLTKTESTDSAIQASNSAISSSDTSNSDNTTSLNLPTTLSSKPYIEEYVKSLINDGYDNSNIETLTVMDAHNTSALDDYKVYAIISWSKETTPDDSRATIESNSNSISSLVNANLDNVTELSLVWRVPYLNGHATAKYKKVDGFLSLYDISFDKKLGGPLDKQATGDDESNTTQNEPNNPQNLEEAV